MRRLSLCVALSLFGCGMPHGEEADAGRLDAGDSGSGGGVDDAGEPDAGTPDGGATDAGVADGGTADAGPTLDAGPGDAGSDAGHGIDPLIVAVGDIACNGNDYCVPSNTCADSATGNVIRGLAPSQVLALGDIQYENSDLASFRGTEATSCATAPALHGYDHTWGSFLSITKPALGNHEYNSSTPLTYIGANYAAYFDPARTLEFTQPGDTTYQKGYYSFDVATSDPVRPWHVIVLNSGKCDCKDSTFCDDSSSLSTQVGWLKADLLAHPTPCTLAVWHHPYFTSGSHQCAANLERMKPFWDALDAANVDLVVNGHDHNYERFYPQHADGSQAPADAGIVEIVVGTGGRNTSGCNARKACTTCTDETLDAACTTYTCAPDAGLCQACPPRVNRNLHSALCVGSNMTIDGGNPIGSGKTLFGVLALTLHPASVGFRYVRAAAESTAPAFADETEHTIFCH